MQDLPFSPKNVVVYDIFFLLLFFFLLFSAKIFDMIYEEKTNTVKYAFFKKN